MATVQDIITRAYRKIGVAADDEALTADQMAAGLDALNDMIHAWVLRGVDVRHIDYEASDNFTLEDEFREGTVYELATRLSPDYQAPVSFNSDEWFRDMRRCYMKVEESEIPTPLVRMPSRYWRTNRVR